MDKTYSIRMMQSVMVNIAFNTLAFHISFTPFVKEFAGGIANRHLHNSA